MSDAIAIPTWVAIAVSVGTPTLTFIGVHIANLLSRRGALELEARSRREETMRNLRWAAELAVSSDQGKASLGLAELYALGQSPLSDEQQEVFIDAALEAVLAEPEEAIEAAESLGEDIVVEVSSISSEAAVGEPTVVQLDTDQTEDGHG